MTANFNLICTVLAILVSQTSGLIMDGGSISPADFIQLQGEMESLKAQLHAVVHNINSECSFQCPRRQSVAFMAQHSANLVNPADHRVVVFDDVMTKVGNAYNKVHGIFTAPVNGTYNFNLIASSANSQQAHSLHLHIIKNSVAVGYIFMDTKIYDDWWMRRSTDVTLHLSQGDEIWVEISGYGEHTLGGCFFCIHI